MNRHPITAVLLLLSLVFIAARPSLEGLEDRVAALSDVYESERMVSLESDPVLPQSVRWDVFCDVGDQAIAGGYQLPSNTFEHHAFESRRGADPRVWSISIVVAPGAITQPATLYAYCLDRTP